MTDLSSARKTSTDSTIPQHAFAEPARNHATSAEANRRRVIWHDTWRGKRFFDIAGALAIAIVFLPIIIGVTVWLLLTPGPVIFGHTRIGRGGKRFKCYKFRTMVTNAEQVLEQLFLEHPELRTEWILNHKLKDDPRITRMGALLRKTSLDELPQIWNVVKGDMSLVGPRPIVEEEIFRYGRAFRHYIAVSPGITGLWQVMGRSDTTYRRRVALDRLYAMNSCIGMDLRILIRTISIVLLPKGAY